MTSAMVKEFPVEGLKERSETVSVRSRGYESGVPKELYDAYRLGRCPLCNTGGDVQFEGFCNKADFTEYLRKKDINILPGSYQNIKAEIERDENITRVLGEWKEVIQRLIGRCDISWDTWDALYDLVGNKPSWARVESYLKEEFRREESGEDHKMAT